MEKITISSCSLKTFYYLCSNSGKLVESSSWLKTYKESVFAYPVVKNRQILNSKDKAVKERLRLPVSTPQEGRYIGTAWGGLFISSGAFGDAFATINKTKSPRYLLY